MPLGYRAGRACATTIDAAALHPHLAVMASLRIKRLPRAFDPSLGEEARAATGLSGDIGNLLAGAAGSSPYLHGLIRQEAAWLPEALAEPDATLENLLRPPDAASLDGLSRDLRRTKRRLALMTALADLSGHWTLEHVTRALTRFADLACDVVIKAQIAQQIRAGRVPGATEADGENAAGLVVLAMGKMGAGELNYSSDIDLICLFDETRYCEDDFFEVRQAMVRATKGMAAALSNMTGDGYVFRTDLRLRPDPAVTPVCLAIEAAERYYESVGRTWERAAYIKARPAAGDLAAGRRFLDTLRPFVWRKHLDFAAIQDAHDMQLKIRASKGLPRLITVPGHDLKLGRGGIRSIEFFAQTRQLIAGGRDENLRMRGTMDALTALSNRGWVEWDVTETLGRHYTTLREAEHRVQMLHDAQTHAVPKGMDDRARMAALMGMDTYTMEAHLQSCLQEVHEVTEAFFSPSPQAVDAEVFSIDSDLLSRWPTYPALRSDRAAEIFTRLQPEIMGRLAKADHPEEALRAFDGFLAGLPAGVQVFSLFEANPQLIDLLIDIAGTAEDLAAYLSRNAGVFDAVIAGDFFSPWPGAQSLARDLSAVLSREADYEAQLVAARRWFKEWHFRVGVHHLRNLVSSREAAAQYADLADAILTAVLPCVQDDFARRHGPAPGRGVALLGMGSLGAGRLHARSDLDLIVIYDAAGAEDSNGPRPLPTRVYFARFTQALITALTAPMSEGRLYEVDMRLRPSGKQGPVATSLQAFRTYQMNDAWLWEHLALTRARVVAGQAQGLIDDIEQVRRTVLQRKTSTDRVLDDVAQMRQRLSDAKGEGPLLDLKTGRGRLQDIELAAQTGTYLAGSIARDVASGLASGADCGWLSVEDASALTEHYAYLSSIHTATRLLSPAMETVPGAGGAEFLSRNGDVVSFKALETRLAMTYADARARIDRAVPQQEATDEG
jgi:glutamate-ammonia-ligase adenylyltransferase